ncbi:hypothetical protein A2631_05425 [Candidatus Daviesbacteria bacterium RIFCSPHIGHO2_01_FULL_44_29]|uniref:DoxX family protein n=1 Tax=Candidatus Daviesbacteria bacterium RIFCSPHIGHO2_02_FULL_43_12 TaxID=1797776 RepID=A0A1F5KI90_9BACT|nr:MAG: hypothetical protein A2631_05425 [Candidatus Daviesbacteria bacterium RIFCSPHIGHO2_01_FULL_44_29]OGE39192.1 MAG: hypothetical protein A3E86_01175 [Candidatus Daviesbacteria bacterium RIFCSPHIGHO2_12_FULL_47_45]OGE40608.1 MAG: hypothetical protein A3D25_00640 [Candidatus Daviesbacteria bacterium RIFCSPHIGHO2_02_FULL_43_12]OGE70167.1 MAG: hypothetical protein A3B55_00415 [Candidatus Daviesbacteria bacterium RIFCSPLOWO2_01_FULL_43_15]
MNSKALLVLRLGLAFVFLYASISSFLFPENWIWFIPDWMQKIIPAEPMLMAHASFELALGIWLISGKKLFYAALVAALDLLAIMLPNIGIFDTVFRDVGLLASAVALALLSRPQSNEQ